MRTWLSRLMLDLSLSWTLCQQVAEAVWGGSSGPATIYLWILKAVKDAARYVVWGARSLGPLKTRNPQSILADTWGFLYY